jgi:hypothetical protein
VQDKQLETKEDQTIQQKQNDRVEANHQHDQTN